MQAINVQVLLRPSAEHLHELHPLLKTALGVQPMMMKNVGGLLTNNFVYCDI